MHPVKVIRQRARRPAEADAPGLCRSDALRLPLMDVFPLILRHKGKNLQNEICDKRAHQVFAVPGIQKRHINNADIRAFFPGQNAPLLLYFRIVPAQAVDAENI